MTNEEFRQESSKHIERQKKYLGWSWLTEKQQRDYTAFAGSAEVRRMAGASYNSVIADLIFDAYVRGAAAGNQQ